jgi:hypothetical protein
MPFYATRQSLLENATTVAAGTAKNGVSGVKTYQAWGTTTAGAGAATIKIQGSANEGATWDDLGTITLTLGTSATSDGFTSDDRYTVVRGNVTAISGADASVNLAMGY